MASATATANGYYFGNSILDIISKVKMR